MRMLYTILLLVGMLTAITGMVLLYAWSVFEVSPWSAPMTFTTGAVLSVLGLRLMRKTEQPATQRQIR